VALSRGSPRVAVDNHPALWSPDVPRRQGHPRRRDRPVDSSVARRILLLGRAAPMIMGGAFVGCHPMTLTHASLLMLAGFLAGAINAVAGGGSLITFPALIAVGLPAVTANVTNAISVFPGYAASVVGSRAELQDQRRRVARLIPAAIIGAFGGAALLLVTPAKAFDLIVPFLVLAASGLLAFQERVQKLTGHPRGISVRRRSVTLQLLTFTGAVYGGYFGGALGVVLVAVLALVLDEPLRRVNALKNALSAVVGATAAVFFVVFGPVSWVSVAVVAPSTVAGGYLGARLARRLPPRVLRRIIVTFGSVVGVTLLLRALR
jgi:uncharacterized membrane protein YfcA